MSSGKKAVSMNLLSDHWPSLFEDFSNKEVSIMQYG